MNILAESEGAHIFHIVFTHSYCIFNYYLVSPCCFHVI